MRSNEEPLSLVTELKWNSEGLIPAIVQEWKQRCADDGVDGPNCPAPDAVDGRDAFLLAFAAVGVAQRGDLGARPEVVESIFVDCDADVLLIKARQKGGACHEGYRSCFFRRIDPEGRLQIIAEPVFEAESVYGSQDRATPGHAVLRSGVS